VNGHGCQAPAALHTLRKRTASFRAGTSEISTRTCVNTGVSGSNIVQVEQELGGLNTTTP
jgi:hypothetical protein